MHLEVIDQQMLELSKRLGFLNKYSFYLAGGTGLALQMGHRKSYDFDFFTSKEFSSEELSTFIKQQNILTESESRREMTYYCVLEGVKTSLIFYDCLLLFPLILFNSIEIADWRDIVTEKLRTVGDRGQKKDFYDLYLGVQSLGIDSIVGFSHKKFGKTVNYFHLLKGITYFDDAERNPEPFLLDKKISWQEVKSFFIDHVQDFEDAFQRIIR